MFAYLKGKLAALGQGTCVIETGGIGWQITVSDRTAAALSRQKDGEAMVYTYLSCGSSDRISLDLFGFSSAEERNLFLLLIGVSGIGPKVTLSILSMMSADDLAVCILGGDAKSIARAQGVGLKTAQKIILELKDKIAKNGAAAPAAADRFSAPQVSDQSEAVNALVVLGYPAQVAAAAVRKAAPAAQDLESLIRLALKSMGEEGEARK